MEDEMVGWHHRLDRHEFEQAPGVSNGQESLACCSPWGRKESDTTGHLNWTVGSSCSPRDSQESSPTPQFKSISSSVLSFLHSPILTSIHEYWKHHSFDYMDLCWQNGRNELSRHLIFPPFFSIKNNTAMNMFVVKFLCRYIIHSLDEFLKVKMLVEEYKFAGF